MALNPADFTYRQKITGAVPGSNLGPTVLLVDGDSVDASFFTKVIDGGGDVRVCSDEAGAQQLPVDLISCVVGTSTLIMHVRKADYLTTGRDLWVFCGNAGLSQPVFDAPFGRNEANQDDEVRYNLAGAGAGEDATGNHGDMIGNARVFDSGNDSWLLHSTIDNPANAEVAFTKTPPAEGALYAYVKTVTNENYNPVISTTPSSYGSKWSNNVATMHGGLGEKLWAGKSVPSRISGASNAYTAGQWGLWCLRYDATTMEFWSDGVLIDSVSVTTDQDLHGLMLDVDSGASGGEAHTEIRYAGFKNNLPSEDDMLVEYANQSSPSTFWTQSAPDDPSVGGTPVTASVTLTAPAPTFAASAEATLPQPSAASAVTIPAPLFSSSASATLPQPSAGVTVTIPGPLFAASASATLPNPTAAADVTIPAPLFAATAGATLPNPTAVVDVTIAAPIFAATAAPTLPNPTASVDFNISGPVFAATASATVTGNVANADITAPAPTFAGTASVTLPQPSASSTITIPGPIFAAVAFVSGNVIITYTETNIDLPELSANITLADLSTNINI
jgi:hypothetical protein